VSGASVAYHLRPNKHVERHLFIDLLDHVDRWNPISSYLYVGFGGIYFEDFKLLHSHFGVDKMLSIENQKWVFERQKFNVPYGCIHPKNLDSSDFIRDVEKFRIKYKVKNILCWLDYATSVELADQLNEIKSVLPNLAANDVFKVTLPANPSILGTKREGMPDAELFERRLEALRNRLLGTQFLPDGLSADRMTERNYPEVLSETFRRAVAEAMKESPDLVFQPLGSYVYKDTTQIATFTGIVLQADRVDDFLGKTSLKEFDLSGPAWELRKIEVPDLSLREKLRLDQVIFKQTTMPGKHRPVDIQTQMRLKFAPDVVDSRRMIENYIRFYRYYPSFHRVTF
jgi:hypothetical protein